MLFDSDIESSPTLGSGHSSEGAGMSPEVPVGEQNTGLNMHDDDLVLKTNEGDADIHSAGSDVVTPRDILQLDATLKELKCTLHYVQTGKVLPIGKTPHTVMAELTVREILGLMELRANGCFHGDAWIMDVNVKEIPSNHGYGSLERDMGDDLPYIIHQEL